MAKGSVKKAESSWSMEVPTPCTLRPGTEDWEPKNKKTRLIKKTGLSLPKERTITFGFQFVFGSQDVFLALAIFLCFTT